MSFIAELKRRNVIRVGVAYAVSAWLVIQVAETIFPLYGFSDAAIRFVISALAVGFIPTVLLAWAFELTPDGVKRERDASRSDVESSRSGRMLDRIIIVVMAVAVGYFAFDKFAVSEYRERAIAESAREEGRADSIRNLYGDLSIAVLPFLDLSPAKNQQHISDGIAEDILNLLASNPELRVISRSSAFFFKGQSIDLPSLAERLDVNYVLEGSVRVDARQLRVAVQLVEARSDTQIWSETYDRTLDNLFAIQDDISTSIAESLEVELFARRATEKKTQQFNEPAYYAYLLGNERLAQRTRTDIEFARQQFELAIQLDDSHAPSYTQLAHSMLLLSQSIYGGDGRPSDVDYSTIRGYLDKAIDLDTDLPDAHGVLGMYHIFRGEFDDARVALDRAIRLNPSYASAYNWRADTALQQNRFLDMLADREKAYSLDPMSIEISTSLAFEYVNFWRPRDAQRIVDRLFERHPDHPLAYRTAIVNLGYHGRHAEAQILSNQAIAALPSYEMFQDWQPIGHYYMGRFDELRTFGNDQYDFLAALVERRYSAARELLEKNLDLENGQWIGNGRTYYRVVDQEDDHRALAELVERQIEIAESKSQRWNERCNIRLIYDLRLLNIREDDAESMMAKCDEVFEQRLQSGYLCPCQWLGLISYTILDGRIDDAIERTDQWLTSGDSHIFLRTDPIFGLLSSRPEYDEFLARNDEQIQRLRQLYDALRDDL